MHPAAAAGYAGAADAYERGRPSYPPATVSALVAALGLRPGTTVLDVGAGTGKLTRLLVPRGAALVAVEPVAAMRDALTAAVPAARVLDGTAEALPLDDGAVDGAVAAQAFHWFDAARALAELDRVVRPGGRVALVWNHRDPDVAWTGELTAVFDDYRGTAPAARDGAWRHALGGWRIAAEQVERWSAPGTLATQVDRCASVSFIAALPAGQRLTAVDRLTAVLAPRVDADGSLPMPYRTELVVLARG